MISEKTIQQAWIDLGFYLPAETDENGFIDYVRLPEDFDIGNLDAKHVPDTVSENRKTLVRPKLLLKISDSDSELNIDDIENILWAICYAEVIARDKQDDDLIDRVKKAQRGLYKVRNKLRLPRDPLKF